MMPICAYGLSIGVSVPGRSVGLNVGLLSVFLGGLLLNPAHLQAQAPSPVVVTEIVERPVAAGQTFVGSITPVRVAAIGSAVDGRVADYPINEGDFVREGQALAQLLTATINLEVEAARGELKLRQEELRELENGSRPAEIRQAAAAMAAAKANEDYHRKNRERAQDLYQRNALNADELQRIISDQIRAEQEYLQAMETHQLMVDGPRQERIEQARAQVAIQQATVEKLVDQLGKHTMKAPFDGFISVEHSEVGQWVQRGELVAEVLAMHEVDILTYIPEQSIRFIQKDLPVNVEIPALPDEVFVGKVAIINPQADLRARTFPVKVRVTNRIDENGPLIKSGMMARATLPTGDRQKSLLVPKDALVLGGPQKLVYVIIPAQGDQPATVRPVPVVLGPADGAAIVVRGELQPGQQVVVRGNDRIRPGQAVNVTKVLPAKVLN